MQIERHPLFVSYVLPARLVPPLFNSYRSENHYGHPIDGAIRPVAGHPLRVRTDISATLFLSDPESYGGGELVLQGEGGELRSFKLPAGTLLLYRSSEYRAILFDFDQTIQKLRASVRMIPAAS